MWSHLVEEQSALIKIDAILHGIFAAKALDKDFRRGLAAPELRRDTYLI
jgi:hypothetical protein